MVKCCVKRQRMCTKNRSNFMVRETFKVFEILFLKNVCVQKHHVQIYETNFALQILMCTHDGQS